MLPKIHHSVILDAGCGSGVPTLRLAELSGGQIVAIEANAQALSVLAEKVMRQQGASRLELVQCHLEFLPFKKATFDIVWAEGSISHLGFPRACDILETFLKSGGHLVIHDDAVDTENKLCSIQHSNLSLIGFFLLTERTWWEEYYGHLALALHTAASVRPPHDLNTIRNELEQFKAEPAKFRSAFFVVSKM